MDKPKRTTPKLTDDEFLSSLKANPAYSGIDIDKEIGKMTAWLSTKKGRILTRPFMVNWLNKIDRPMNAPKPFDAMDELRKRMGENGI